MDELAYELASTRSSCGCATTPTADPRGNPWSSDGLEECLRLGADASAGRAATRGRASTRDGDWLIGTGMAAAGYPVAFFMPEQRARARIFADGSAVVQTSTQEFGTGGSTVMAQVAADALGVDLDAVRFRGRRHRPAEQLGRGRLGRGRMVSAAVHAAATALRDQLIAMAIADEHSPLHGADPAL